MSNLVQSGQAMGGGMPQGLPRIPGSPPPDPGHTGPFQQPDRRDQLGGGPGPGGITGGDRPQVPHYGFAQSPLGRLLGREGVGGPQAIQQLIHQAFTGRLGQTPAGLDPTALSALTQLNTLGQGVRARHGGQWPGFTGPNQTAKPKPTRAERRIIRHPGRST